MAQLPAVLIHRHGEGDDAGVEQAREDVARTWPREASGAAEIIHVRVAGLVEAETLKQGEISRDRETPYQ